MEYHHGAVTKFLTQFSDEDMTNLDPVIWHCVQRVYDEVSMTLNPSPELEEKLTDLFIEEPCGVEVTLDTGSSRLTESQLRHIYKENFKRGRFTSQEKKTVFSNWHTFTKLWKGLQRRLLGELAQVYATDCRDKQETRAIYNLDNPMLFMNMRTSKVCMLLGPRNLIHFKMFLAQGLHGRSLYSVYRTWMNQYCTQAKQRFTVCETRLLHMLDQLSREKGDNRFTRFNVLSLAVQRSRSAVANKLNELATPKPVEEVDWTLEREQELVRAVVEYTNASCLDDLRELHGKRMWREATKELSFSYRQAYYRWHYHIAPALFPTRWRKRLHLQTDIIRRLWKQLQKGKVTDWREVDWASIACRVGDYGSLFVYRSVMSLRWNRVKDKETRSNMSDSINILVMHLLDLNKVSSLKLPRPPAEASSGRCLRRAKYKFKSRKLKNIKPPWLCEVDDLESSSDTDSLTLKFLKEELPDYEEMMD